MKYSIEYRAAGMTPRVDGFDGEFADAAAALAFAIKRAESDDDLSWVHSIVLRDESGPVPHWTRAHA
jgi:hypothetical protein